MLICGILAEMGLVFHEYWFAKLSVSSFSIIYWISLF
jgi:hypothetical protein